MSEDIEKGWEILGNVKRYQEILRDVTHSRALFQKTLMRLSITIHAYQLSLVIEMFDYDFNLSVRAKWNMK